MKNYLSRDERQIATYVCIMYGLIDTIFKYKDNISKEEVTNLKYANTYLAKYIDALIKRVGAAEGDRIYRQARDNVVDLKPRNYDGQYIVDKDSLEEVCRMAVEKHCFGCKRQGWHNCGLYKCMDKMGVGRVNDDNNGRCEFYYDKSEVES